MKENKPFYRLNNKNKERDIVEYSTDFNFFMKHQICGIRNNTGMTEFYSSLESKRFAIKETKLICGEVDIRAISFQIHKEILDGKHGVGKLVD